MAMSIYAYLFLLVAVACLRLAEVLLSSRNQHKLSAKGVSQTPEPHFRWMVLFHAGILISAGLEVAVFHRPLIPALAISMGLIFVCATGLRWWVIHVMSEHWNIRVMNSVDLGVVADGPFRWVRHPNYVAVFVELIALPLIHTAWCTALFGGVIQVWILAHRLRLEESILMRNSKYVAVMGSKPQFLPRVFAKPSTEASASVRND